MAVDAGVGREVSPPLDELRGTSRAAPAPLEDCPHTPTGWTDSAQERLASLHCTIQRTIDHADIPQRSGGQTQSLHTRRAVSEARSNTVQEELNKSGEVAYMVCVEQLLLAQFESMGRKDIMLEYAHLYADLSLLFRRELNDWRLTLSSLDLATAARDAESVRDLSLEAMRLTLDETSDRHTQIVEEMSERSDMLHFFLTSHAPGPHGTLHGLKGARDDSTLPLERSNSLERQLLHYEVGELDEAPSAQILAQEGNIFPPAANCENIVLPPDLPGMKDMPNLAPSSPSASAVSYIRRFLAKPSPTSYPVLSGNMYRSSVPYVMWQLRLFHFEDGVLRYTNVPTCSCSDLKHHWWTVLAACDLVHIENENTEAAIGEPRPPLGRNRSCCFSIYYRKHSESATRRLRCCCTTRNEVMSWVLALRHAMRVAKRIGSNVIAS